MGEQRGPDRRAGPRDPASVLLDVYDAALPEVYGYLLARCGYRTTAEELTSETFLGAVGSLRRRATEPDVAWLVGIARHKLVDHWRRQGRERRSVAAHGVPEEEHDPWNDAIDAVRARDTLAVLSEDQRSALVLRHVDGLPVPEVAAHLGRTVTATEALLSRARSAFRRHFTEAPREPQP